MTVDENELRAAIERRVAERIAQDRLRRERQQADRAAKKARRAAGLRARHARKIARINNKED